MRKFHYLLFVALAAICIFDPRNQLTGLKDATFLLLASIAVFGELSSSVRYRRTCAFPIGLVVVAVIFGIGLPLASLCIAVLRYGSSALPIGLEYFRSFLFVSVAIFLFRERFQLLPAVIKIMLMQALCIVSISLIVTAIPELVGTLENFGNRYGIFALQYRTYGQLSLPGVYFHTSPLLIIPTAYFTYRLVGDRKLAFGNLFFLSLCLVSMLLSGTRNNLFASLLCVLFVVMCYGSRKSQTIVLLGASALGCSVLARYAGTLVEMFSPAEKSNALKLGMVSEYLRQGTDLATFFFGQGLGSSFFSEVRANATVSNSELTYLEIFRRFGVFSGILLVGTMFYPLLSIRRFCVASLGWLLVAYSIFLLMISFNPFFFSSVGLLFYAIILAEWGMLKVSRYEHHIVAQQKVAV